MGCGLTFGNDFEKCDSLIDDYEYLLEREEDMKLTGEKLENHNREKENLKEKIRELLESINQNITGIGQIDRLQRLNQKFQDLLTEESKIKNYY